MAKRTGWKWAAGVLIGVIMLLVLLYLQRGVEKRTLNGEARSEAPGEFIALGDGTTQYFLEGPEDGPLVVFVHGFSVPAYVWEQTSKALNAAGYRTLRYDLFGRGYSDRPEVEYNHGFFTRQLSELITGLELTGPKVLVGLSMGGPIAASYLVDHPDETIALVLAAPEITQSTRGDIFPLNVPGVGEYLMAAVMEPYVLPKLQAGDFHHPELYPEWEELYRPQFQFKGTGRALLSSIRELTAFNPEEVYQKVRESGKPVLLIWGKDDQTISRDQILVLQGILPDLETVLVEDAGHLAHYEKGALVESEILGFLSELDW